MSMLALTRAEGVRSVRIRCSCCPPTPVGGCSDHRRFGVRFSLGCGDEVGHGLGGDRGVPDRSAGGHVEFVHELVGIALGEVPQLRDPDRLQACDDSRPAEADREHLLPLAGGDWRHAANAASMLANSRLSDWCWDSNSSSGMSRPWNIVKLKAVWPSGSATTRVGKIAI
jgi:hypothetical protein